MSARALYRYTDAGIFGIGNIDLPKKVRYKARKTISKDDRPVDRASRSYSDFLELAEDARAKAMQIDTVMGIKKDFKCIFTLHFPLTQFQFHILLDEHKSVRCGSP